MTGELLTAVIVNYNTSDFIGMSLFVLTKLTKNAYKVIICDNGSRYLDKRKLKKIVNKYGNVELFFRKQSTSGSMGHGESLNLLIEKIDTPYGVILDADAAFLKNGWDDILINQLGAKVKIIGCPPVKNPIKPSDFPSVYATLFDTKTFKSLKIDTRPKDYKAGLDTGVKFWRRKIREHIKRDFSEILFALNIILKAIVRSLHATFAEALLWALRSTKVGANS